jgi:hypothetical protein
MIVRAYKLVSTDKEDDVDHKSMEIGTIIEDKVYFITCYAEEWYSDYLPITIQKTVDPLKINTSNN